MRMIIEAVQRLQPPTMPKGCRHFSRVVNFFGLFCPKLLKLLKLIYNLMRKEGVFHSEGEQQNVFEEIKRQL